MKRNLPEVLYFTTREAAYDMMEAMSENGFATEVKTSGNVYAVVTLQQFEPNPKKAQNQIPAFNFTYESGAEIRRIAA